jgi:hypothetical protein
MNDISTLHTNADFELVISPGVKWVPFSTLGRSKFTNQEIISISSDQAVDRLTNVYEWIQYIKIHDWKPGKNLKYETRNNRIWELHANGKHLLDSHQGNCATYAGFVSAILSRYYQHVYNLTIVTNKGNGHAMNIVRNDGKQYIVDLYSQLNLNSDYNAIETGNWTDFIHSRNISGICLEISDLHHFTKFYRRFQISRNLEFLFFTSTGNTIPPISMNVQSESNDVLLYQSDILKIDIKEDFKRIQCRLISN